MQYIYINAVDLADGRYLFVAIDRATRWVFLHICHDMSDTSSIDFLRRLKDASPVKIAKIVTDTAHSSRTVSGPRT